MVWFNAEKVHSDVRHSGFIYHHLSLTLTSAFATIEVLVGGFLLLFYQEELDDFWNQQKPMAALKTGAQSAPVTL